LTSPANQSEQVTELLADQALGWLTFEEEQELQTLGGPAYEEDGLSLMMTCSVLEVSLLKPSDIQGMPVAMRRRLEASGAAWAVTMTQGPVLRVPGWRGRRSIAVVTPWLAAAACLTLAVFAWRAKAGNDLVARATRDPNRVELTLAAWQDPSLAAPEGQQPCLGHLCWSQDGQCGFLTLERLPANDCKHQYQVWILDEHGGQRISAGIFDCKGECVVPIQPGIPIHEAKEFAITMEEPGGTWNSDMSHKVAIAHCNKH
jgi:hypothetical protein